MDVRGWSPAAPLTLIFGTHDNLIRGECKEAFLAAQDGAPVPAEQMQAAKRGVHCVELDGGHEVRLHTRAHWLTHLHRLGAEDPNSSLTRLFAPQVIQELPAEVMGALAGALGVSMEQ